MALYQLFRPRPLSVFNDLLHDLRRIERQIDQIPFWENSIGESSQQPEIRNDGNKFEINLNVSQFKPEELNVHLNGRELKIEGNQEIKNEHGFSKRSFSRTIQLPSDVDFSAIVSNLTNDGKLCIEGPKIEIPKGKSIPIQKSQPIKENPVNTD